MRLVRLTTLLWLFAGRLIVFSRWRIRRRNKHSGYSNQANYNQANRSSHYRPCITTLMRLPVTVAVVKPWILRCLMRWSNSARSSCDDGYPADVVSRADVC